MQEKRGISAAEHACQQDLTPGRRHQIGTSNHECDRLTQVVNGDRELVGPVTVAIPRKQIAALLGWRLSRLHRGARRRMSRRPLPSCTRMPRPVPASSRTRAASPVVPLAADVGPRTFAGVDVRRCAQGRRAPARRPRACRSVAGAGSSPASGSKPSQARSSRRAVSYSGRLRMRSWSSSAKQHAAAERARDAPDVDGVDDVSEVEIASG